MERITLDDFVSEITDDIKSKGDFKSHVGTLEAFAAHKIYNSVKTDKNQISELTLANLLGIDFEEDSKVIVGKLSQNYVDETFVLEEKEIKFKDADGTLHENPNIGGNISWKGTEKQKTRELLSKFMQEYLITEETTSLNYLGLEGPNFRSFLELAHSAKGEGVELKGTFVEYNRRTYNLMESIINSNLGQKVFENSRLIFGEINELMHLDFVRDENIRCDWDKRKLNGMKVDLVHYNGTDIEYVDYLQILDDINQGNLTEKELLDKWKDLDIHKKYKNDWNKGLSEEFLETMMNRYEEKFDVVFLDYMGQIIPRFLLSLENLVQRRINERALIAIVHDDRWKTHSEELDKDNLYNNSPVETEEDSKKTPEDMIKTAFRRGGYESKPLTEETIYCGERNSTKMRFQVWYVERNRDEEE